MTTTTATSINAQVATELAAAGFSIFPCHPGGPNVKKPMPGVFWRSASTSDRVKVESWWRRWPDAAVALDLAKSGLVVIDADRHGEDDGVEAVASLMHENGFDPNPVPTVATPNAGTHFYFRQPQPDVLGNGRGALPAGIDVRGSGGYVIAPGTHLADGRVYEGFGEVSDAPVLPDWLLSILQSKPATTRQLQPKFGASLDGDFFFNVNRRAMGSLSLWVPSLFGPAARGTATGGYRVSSRDLGRELQEDLSIAPAGIVDFGVYDMGDPREGKRTPIDLALEYGKGPDAKAAAFWLCGELGVSPSSLGWDQSEYVSLSPDDYETSERLRANFDKRERIDPETGEVIEYGIGPDLTAAGRSGSSEAVDGITPTTSALDIDPHLLHPPGLVGDLADWICDWTAEPIRIHAIGAALVIVGTLLGRKVYSRTRPTSTALYIGAIAPSGMGKQHPQDAIRLVLQDVTGGATHYSGWAVSLPKMVVDLQTNAAKVMVADEFADKMIGIRSKNASTSQMAISEGLRSLWGTNTGTYSPDVSLSRGDGNIMRPCLSFYGASTIKDFARSLVSKDITNGLFNRFLILPRFDDVDQGVERDGVMVLPAGLKDRLSWLFNCVPPMQMTLAARGDGYPTPILVPMTGEAEAVNEQNKTFQLAQMRASDADDALMLWGRFAEQVKRVAMIVAAGRVPEDASKAEISLPDIQFATNLVRYSIDQFIGIVRRDMVESWVQAQHKLVLGIVRQAGTISRNELVRKVDGRIQRKPLAEIIASLIEANSIEAATLPSSGRGRPKEIFRFLQD